MGWSDLTIAPGMCKTLQKTIEICVAVREHVDTLARDETGEMMLHGLSVDTL